MTLTATVTSQPLAQTLSFCVTTFEQDTKSCSLRVVACSAVLHDPLSDAVIVNSTAFEHWQPTPDISSDNA